MESIDDRLHLFQDRMCGEVKRKLYSGRKYDPEIRIEIPVEEDVFEVSIAARARRERNKQVYRICNHDLDTFLGVKWDGWILNANGDYACDRRNCEILVYRKEPYNRIQAHRGKVCEVRN